MSKNIGEGPKVPRSVLPYQSIDDLPPIAPEISPLVTVESGENYKQRIRDFKTIAGDQPYKDANIEIKPVNPSDPKLKDKIFIIQNYAQQSKLNDMLEFAAWLRYLGVDLFNLPGRVDVHDESGATIASIEPSFIEVDRDKNHKIVAGTHRFLAGDLLGASPACVLISNYSEIGKNPFEPVPISQVHLAEGVPEDNKKRTLMAGASSLDLINFSMNPDTVDARTNENTYNNRFRHLKFILPETAPEEKRNKLKEAGIFLTELRQNADFLEGIILASELNPEFPEFIRLDDVTDLDNRYMISFRFAWTSEDQDGRVFKILAEKPGVTKKYSIGILLDSNDSESLQLINSTKNLPPKYNSPVTSQEQTIDNSPYYTGTQFIFDDGTKECFITNKTHIKGAEILPENFKIHGQGTILIAGIHGQPGQYLLCTGDYKAILGGSLHRGPTKCFGFVTERVETNLGVKLTPDNFKSVITLIADPVRNLDMSPNDIIFLEVDESQLGTYPTRNQVEGTYEYGEPEMVSAAEIYDDLRYGKIVDDASQAPLFIALARDGQLQLNKDFAQMLIPFAEIHDPVNDLNTLILPDSTKAIGRRIGGLGFSDVGKSWINGMTTIAGAEHLQKFTDQRLTTVTVAEVFEGVKNGRFDLETTAHLSRLFINGNLLKTNFT